MKKYLWIIGAVMLMAFAPQQTTVYTLSGTVASADDGSTLPGVNVAIRGSTHGTVTDVSGNYRLENVSGQETLVFSAVGYKSKEVAVQDRVVINVALPSDVQSLQEVVVIGYGRASRRKVHRNQPHAETKYAPMMSSVPVENHPAHNTENYATIHENGFRPVAHSPLSTFSIDVDAASYSNVRRFINQGQMPPKDAVRTEEMVNYFTYDYAPPTDGTPFSVTTELSDCPWNEAHRLLHIGLQGREIPTEDLPPSNLVFLIDVSGSMNYSDKLPLLKSGFRLLVNRMRPEDRVAIVVYAGAAGQVLPSTSGREKEKILRALDQ